MFECDQFSLDISVTIQPCHRSTFHQNSWLQMKHSIGEQRKKCESRQRISLNSISIHFRNVLIILFLISIPFLTFQTSEKKKFFIENFLNFHFFSILSSCTDQLKLFKMDQVKMYNQCDCWIFFKVRTVNTFRFAMRRIHIKIPELLAICASNDSKQCIDENSTYEKGKDNKTVCIQTSNIWIECEIFAKSEAFKWKYSVNKMM